MKIYSAPLKVDSQPKCISTAYPLSTSSTQSQSLLQCTHHKPPSKYINQQYSQQLEHYKTQQLIISDKQIAVMGNIEIRDQQTTKRRTSIFTPRNSIDPTKQTHRKSLTQRYDRSRYSPIRYSKVSDRLNQNTPLTERKSNVIRHSNQYELSYSPIVNQQNLQNIKTDKSPFTLPAKLQNIQIDTSYDPQNVPASQRTGKIVSNSNRRMQDQRKSYQFFEEIMNKDKPLNSPLQTKDIIRKVRNFNDFLNQIKRKLKQDKQQTLLRNKSRLEEFNKNHPSQQKIIFSQNTKVLPLQQQLKEQNSMQKTKSMRRIEVALKLQNEKIQLQKYRKLVERQLSKTHSIENISLCTKNSGQKILTIQYESILNQNMFQPNNSKGSLVKQPSQKSLINRIIENQMHHKKLEDRMQNEVQKEIKIPKYENNQKDQQKAALLKRLKNQYQKMLQNVLQLGRTIERYQMNESIVQSRVLDNKILIQEPSNFSKKSSGLSKARKDSGINNDNQNEFRLKQSQSKQTETQIRQTEQQSRMKFSQASRRSMECKVVQFDRAQLQYIQKAMSQRSGVDKGSEKSIKQQGKLEKQVFDDVDQGKDDRKNEKGNYHFEKRESGGSKVWSRASKNSNKVEQKQNSEVKKGNQEMVFDERMSNKESQVSQKDVQMNQKGSQVSQRGSEVNQKDSQVSQRGSQASQRGSQASQRGSQGSSRGSLSREVKKIGQMGQGRIDSKLQVEQEKRRGSRMGIQEISFGSYEQQSGHYIRGLGNTGNAQCLRVSPPQQVQNPSNEVYNPSSSPHNPPTHHTSPHNPPTHHSHHTPSHTPSPPLSLPCHLLAKKQIHNAYNIQQNQVSHIRQNRQDRQVQKIQQIQSLFERLNNIQQEYKQRDRQVRQVLGLREGLGEGTGDEMEQDSSSWIG